jgi:hypothetical protein
VRPLVTANVREGPRFELDKVPIYVFGRFGAVVPELCQDILYFRQGLVRCGIDALSADSFRVGATLDPFNNLPPAPETERLVDAAALGLMKRGTVPVNTARGGLVDDAALADALESRHLGAAGLDVFATEPVPRDHPLLALDNVVVSVGAAGRTPEALRRALRVAAKNARRLRDGRPLLPRVA